MSDLLPLTPLDHRLNRIQIIKLKLVAVRNGNGQIGIAIVLWQKTHKNKARGNNKIDESHNTGKVVDFMGGKHSVAKFGFGWINFSRRFLSVADETGLGKQQEHCPILNWK